MRGFPVYNDTDVFAEHNLYRDVPGESPNCPPLSGDVICDVAIIGAGLSGLATAQFLHEGGAQCVILERHMPGYGASGRNGGQLWPGYFSRLDTIQAKLGKHLAGDLWQMSVEGVGLVRDMIAANHFECGYAPGALLTARTPEQRKGLEGYMTLLARDHHYVLETFEKHRIESALGTSFYNFGAYDPLGGSLHPLQYTNALARKVTAHTPIHGRSPAQSIKRANGRWRIDTPKGCVLASRLVLCGDSYLGDLFPKLRRKYVLIRNGMIATKPLPGAHSRMSVCEFDDFLQFFRYTADNRLIFGGGDTVRPKMTPIATQDKIIRLLEQNISNVFPALKPHSISHRWGGFIGMTSTMMPYIGRFAPELYYAGGYSGHGLGLTHIAGKVIAEQILGQSSRIDTFARIRNITFPGLDKLDFLLARLGMALHAA